MNLEDFEWMKTAPCKGRTDLFFPPGHSENTRTRYKRERDAKNICNECPVLFQCRRWAREHGEMGIWGGETESERWAAGYMRNNIVMRRSRAASEYRIRLRERELSAQTADQA